MKVGDEYMSDICFWTTVKRNLPHLSYIFRKSETLGTEFKTVTCSVTDRVQPKTSPFSTRHLILLNYKGVSQLSQPILLSFSYLNSARQNLVIELCRAIEILNGFFVI